jgi:hypothetical protein
MTKKEFDLIKKIYERSGANVGPRQPMSEDMKRRINAEMDKMGIGGKKTSGGGSGGSSSDTREMQLGSELDPKAMMKREGMKRGGSVKKMAMGGMGQRPLATPGKPSPRPRIGPRDIGTGTGPRPTMGPRPRDIGTGTGPRPTMPRGPLAQALNKPAGMMKKGGSVKKMAGGGLAAGHKSADGVARKGKTKAEQVKMAGGGKTKKYC